MLFNSFVLCTNCVENVQASRERETERKDGRAMSRSKWVHCSCSSKRHSTNETEEIRNKMKRAQTFFSSPSSAERAQKSVQFLLLFSRFRHADDESTSAAQTIDFEISALFFLSISFHSLRDLILSSLEYFFLLIVAAAATAVDWIVRKSWDTPNERTFLYHQFTSRLLFCLPVHIFFLHKSIFKWAFAFRSKTVNKRWFREISFRSIVLFVHLFDHVNLYYLDQPFFLLPASITAKSVHQRCLKRFFRQ